MATTKTIQSRQQQKYSTSTEWSNANPLLLKGEIAVVKIGNSYRFKVGDGTSKYNALPFVDEGVLANKVDKRTDTSYIGQGVYGFTSDGSTVAEKTIFTDSQAANISGTIPLRITDGNIPVPETPINNTAAASKKYVDDADSALNTQIGTTADGLYSSINAVNTKVENKLDKITSTDTSTATARAYVVLNDGTQSSLRVTNYAPAANYIAQYTANGRLLTNTPINNGEVANKKYVDDAVAGASGGSSSFDAAYVPAGIQAGSGSWCTYKYLNENTVYVQFNIKNNSMTRGMNYYRVAKGLPIPALYSSAYYAGNILCESAKITTGTIDGTTTIAIDEEGDLVTPSVSSAIKDVYGSLTYPTNEKHYATYKLTGYPSTTLSAQTIQFMANGTKYYGIRAINMGTDAYDVEYKTSSFGSSWTTAFDGTSMSWYLGTLTFLAEPSSTLVTWMLKYGSKL